MKDIFGLRNLKRFSGAFKIPKGLYNMAIHIETINPWTVLVSALCIIYLILFKEVINPRIKKRCKIEFPSELVLVIIFKIISLNFKSILCS